LSQKVRSKPQQKPAPLAQSEGQLIQSSPVTHMPSPQILSKRRQSLGQVEQSSLLPLHFPSKLHDLVGLLGVTHNADGVPASLQGEGR